MKRNFIVFEWPEPFKVTADNVQDLIKHILVSGTDRPDIILPLDEVQRACLDKHLNPTYNLITGKWNTYAGNSAFEGSVKGYNTASFLKEVDTVYLYLGCKLFIVKKEKL